MLVRGRTAAAWLLAATLLISLSARADDTTPHSAPTSPLTYDARVVGLAGAGVATADGAAASVHNPALLVKITQRAGTLSFTPYLMKLSAPFRYGNNAVVQKQSGVLFGPFSQLGLALRVHPRIVIGMLGFITGAAGGTFSAVPLNAFSSEAPRGEQGNVNVGQFAGELQVPLAVEIAPWLGIAVAYRLTQAFTFANVTEPSGTPLAKVSLRGTHLSGFQAGIVSRIGRQWTLGASYRSEIILDLSGLRREYSTTVISSSETLARGYRTPQQVRAGVSYAPSYFEHLMVTAEGHLELYKRLDVRERNTFGGAVAAEYALLDRLQLRAGFGAASQPLAMANASAVAPPPGMGYSLSGGAGILLAAWRLDLALAYALSGGDDRAASVAGRYAAEGFIGSASATYAL